MAKEISENTAVGIDTSGDGKANFSINKATITIRSKNIEKCGFGSVRKNRSEKTNKNTERGGDRKIPKGQRK